MQNCRLEKKKSWNIVPFTKRSTKSTKPEISIKEPPLSSDQNFTLTSNFYNIQLYLQGLAFKLLFGVLDLSKT